MLYNEGILKNGENVFKAQVVDSYLNTNAAAYNTVTIYVSGATISNPVKVYYRHQTGTTKSVFWYANSIYNAETRENSVKKYLFSGNLESIFEINLYNYYYYDNYQYSDDNYFGGNFLKFIYQFPNLQKLTFQTESRFNEDISNIKLPSNFNSITLQDYYISGDITTIENFNKIKELNLTYCQLSGVLSDLPSTDYTRISVSSLGYLGADMGSIINNNPNLKYFSVSECSLWSGNASLMDVSNLTYINFSTHNNTDFIGDCTNWTFNTGLTTFNWNNGYVDGDITNWDFSDTNMTGFYIYNRWNGWEYAEIIHGSMSGWTLPSTLSSFSLYYVSGITSIPNNFGNTQVQSIQSSNCLNIENDINDFIFSTGLTSFYFDNYYASGKGKLCGNFETFQYPSGVTSLNLRNNSITGNLSNITLSPDLFYAYLDNNLLVGDLTDLIITEALYLLGLGRSSGITATFDSPYDIERVQALYLNNIQEISGDLSNLIFTNLGTFETDNTDMSNCDISNFDLSNIYYVKMQYCSLDANISNWFSGSTTTYSLDISSNPNLSGDTSNWNVDSIRTLNIQYTKLSGALKHNDIYQLMAGDTEISSDIETDLDFSSSNYVDISGTNVHGHLSGVTLGSGQYVFYCYDNPNVYGSNEFADYVFINRRYFNYYYMNISIANIGDTINGIAETSGNTGTYTGEFWDLTEAQVNDLADGNDWDGNGTNTPWTSKEKIFWFRNAQVSSTNSNLRYLQISFSYS